MIISRTPFRISLAGGGSDLAAYYRHATGNVVSMAINRYMYVTVNRRFDDLIRVSYTQTEIVEHVDDLQHDLIREAMRMTGVDRGVEITTIADLPAGIGLGSSSTLTVGVLNALDALGGHRRSPADLARRACEIEIEILQKPIGKQDQYIAAYGGLQDIYFHPDETVSVHPVLCPPERRDQLVRRLMLFYTGVHRDAGSVLGEARRRLNGHEQARTNVSQIVDIAGCVRDAIGAGCLHRIGKMLDASWQLKKQMASAVSNGQFDLIYERALDAGAEGGKIAGAGGGGCLLLVVPPPRRASVRRTMQAAGLREVPVGMEIEGSRIIHYSS
jgi:D-glycero-alpha-D-manno-heptose-7-phosphate kinase